MPRSGGVFYSIMSNNKNSISVIGCGWLGFPLAKRFVKDGYEVFGSTTTEEKIKLLSNAGINPFLFDAENPDKINAKQLFGSDYTIITIPPVRNKSTSDYGNKIKNILRSVMETNISSKIIFTSSTSVYGNIEGIVNEDSPTRPNSDSGKAVLEAEKIIRNSKLRYAILRLSGLVGNDRHPVNYLAGRKNLNDPDHPVNLIHLDDCIEIICEVIKNEFWDETLNCCSPDHPSRKEYYVESAKKRNLKIPEFTQVSNGKGKIISSQKLIDTLNYKFIYPSPFDFK